MASSGRSNAMSNASETRRRYPIRGVKCGSEARYEREEAPNGCRRTEWKK
jgi:hypothetical protein